jgi:hypothetical protein
MRRIPAIWSNPESNVAIHSMAWLSIMAAPADLTGIGSPADGIFKHAPNPFALGDAIALGCLAS